MLIRIPKGWEIPERLVTPEDASLNRRRFLARASGAALGAMGGVVLGASETAGKKPAASPEETLQQPLKAERNPKYTVERPITSEHVATHVNNYYEFSEAKNQVWKLAEAFQPHPWQIEIKGLVEKPRKLDVEEIIRQMPLEERVYRHRCVEAWSMVVPWVGFPMKKFVQWCAPLSKAHYLRMVSFFRPNQAVGQARSNWYPWPYFDGLTLEEATNELTMLVVGMYGKTLPPQNGAPLRLITPWKYGYKGIKGIVRFEFTEKQPPCFWNVVVANEYDFWANVNPQKPHPRWSQASEVVVETGERIPSLPYNGYGKYVAHLYPQTSA